MLVADMSNVFGWKYASPLPSSPRLASSKTALFINILFFTIRGKKKKEKKIKEKIE